MEDIFKKWKKKIQKDSFSDSEVTPDSDFPVHERHTKQDNIQKMNTKKKKPKQ